MSTTRGEDATTISRRSIKGGKNAPDAIFSFRRMEGAIICNVVVDMSSAMCVWLGGVDSIMSVWLVGCFVVISVRWGAFFHLFCMC